MWEIIKAGDLADGDPAGRTNRLEWMGTVESFARFLSLPI